MKSFEDWVLESPLIDKEPECGDKDIIWSATVVRCFECECNFWIDDEAMVDAEDYRCDECKCFPE